MARTAAALTGRTRLSDCLGVSAIGRVQPRELARAGLRSPGRDNRRRCDLRAKVTVCYVIAMALFRTVSVRESLRGLVDGQRWIRPDLAVGVSGKPSISRAWPGAAPFSALRDSCVAPLAHGTGGCASRSLTARC